MIIPPDQLDPDTLTRLLEDFVTRDGTDNGDDTPLDVRVRRARGALERREAVIVFHPLTQQCDLLMRHDVPREWLDEASAD